MGLFLVSAERERCMVSADSIIFFLFFFIIKLAILLFM